jgi:cellulase/cellobiase CelA1
LAKCQQAENAYITGISYTIQQIATLPNVVVSLQSFRLRFNLSFTPKKMYLDAAHGGWLGWDDNRQKIAQVFNNVLNKAGGANKIRGFVTNLANYQPLGTLSSSGTVFSHCVLCIFTYNISFRRPMQPEVSIQPSH